MLRARRSGGQSLKTTALRGLSSELLNESSVLGGSAAHKLSRERHLELL